MGLMSSPQMQHFFVALGGTRKLMDGFLAAEVGIFGTVISAYGVAACARLRSDESLGLAEILLSTPTSRARFAASHFAVALAGVAALLLGAGASIGLGHAVATGDTSQVVRVAGAAAAQIPAAWVMVSLVVLLFGWAPRAVPMSWGILVVFVAFGEFGMLWGLPSWLLNVSPYAHSPRLPGNPVNAASLAGLLVAAGALASAGFVGWRRRDLAA
jgi:ABC-2 type transport system permease protein